MSTTRCRLSIGIRPKIIKIIKLISDTLS